MAAKILIGGATGTNGKEIVKVLSEKGVDLRALVRSGEKASSLKGPNVELVEGDYGDRKSLENALQGIEVAYFIGAIHKDYPVWFTNFIKSAKQAGVRRVVKFSGMGASMDAASEIIRTHGQTDRELLDSGLDYTIIRPNSFYQNMFTFAQSIKDQGAFYLNMGEEKQSMVDVRDITAVGAKVLTEPGHEGKIYQITGPEALTYHELARKLSKAVGKEISYIPITDEQAEQGMLSVGMPQWNAHVLSEVFGYFASGKAREVTDTVKQVTGKAPLAFDQFAEDFSGVFK